MLESVTKKQIIKLVRLTVRGTIMLYSSYKDRLNSRNILISVIIIVKKMKQTYLDLLKLT